MSMRCQLSPNSMVTTPSRSYVQPRSVPKTFTGGVGGNAAAAGSRAGTSGHSRVVWNAKAVGSDVLLSLSLQAEAVVSNSPTAIQRLTSLQPSDCSISLLLN